MTKRQSALVLLLFLTLATPAAGEEVSAALKSLEQYILEARAAQAPLVTEGGSLFTNSALSSLFIDLKARRVNDIITVRVVESTVAQSSADAQTSRNSGIALGVPNFFGVENNSPDFPFDRLLTTTTNMQFKGNGSTNRSGTALALLSGRVAEVLPNGDLVIEAMKEVKINNEQQILRVFGIVRSVDVGPDNVVLSGAIANMLLQIDGKGALSDSLRQGWLFRLLTKIWPF
jgi:flagellar L-ring protein precursor FlgH